MKGYKGCGGKNLSSKGTALFLTLGKDPPPQYPLDALGVTQI
jgi:hypothetical protein